MSNLQWRLTETELPVVISDDELKKYKEGLMLCLNKFDDDIIMKQKHCSPDVRIDLISKKYKRDDFITYENADLLVGFDSSTHSRLSNSSFKLEFLKISDTDITISARKTILSVFGKIDDAYAKIGDEVFKSKTLSYMSHGKFLGEDVSIDCQIDIAIPKEKLSSKINEIQFYVVKDGIEILNTNISSGPFFPIEKRYKNAYFYNGGYVYQLEKAILLVKKVKRTGKYERKLLRELWKSNRLGERKAIIARILAKIYKPL